MRLCLIVLVLLYTTRAYAQPYGTYKVSFETEETSIVGKITHVLYPVRDSTALYMRMDNHYHAFVDKMSATKDRYIIKFADGSSYSYDLPFFTKLPFTTLPSFSKAGHCGMI